MHTHICVHTLQKAIFISQASHSRRSLSLASAALSFPPHHSCPLPSWRLGSAGKWRKPLSWWKNHHGNMALSPAPKGLGHVWLLILAQMKHMGVFLVAWSVVTLSYLSPLSRPTHAPGLLTLLWIEFPFFSRPGWKCPMPIYLHVSDNKPALPKGMVGSHLPLWFRAPGKGSSWINVLLRRERDAWRKRAAFLGWWRKCWSLS